MTKEDKFECREKYLIRCFFGKFGLSRMWCNKQYYQFFTSMLHYKCYFWNWVHDGGTRTCSRWGSQIWKCNEVKKSSTPWKLRTVKTLMQGTPIDNFPIKNLSTTKFFLMPSLIEEMEPVVLVKFEFEYREKLKIGCFFRNFRTVRTLTQEKKTFIFKLNIRPQVLCFWLRFWWRKLKCWWLRNKSLIMERN